MPFFQGIHDHTLDAKNRLTIPARIRRDLAGGLVLAKGFDPCLQVYPEDVYRPIVESALAGMNPLSPQARELKRHLYGNSLNMELDSAGRIMLPALFMAHAKIGKDVVVVGAGDCLEIWDRSTWQDIDRGLIASAAEHIAGNGHPA